MNDKEFGLYLLSKPFRIWFRFAFRAVEGKRFIIDTVHEYTFDLYERIFAQDITAYRVCLNQPPRSAKTTLMAYFFVFCCLNASCNFIYTTFSGQLLKDMRARIASIVNSDWFGAFYGKAAFALEIEEEAAEFIDDSFKKAYDGQGIKLSNTKIKLGSSMIYLTPLGSTTGLGAGVMGIADRYTGGIFMDDINKVTDTLMDKILNQKVRDYYSTNILTRINNEKINILNTQQRISEADLSEFLLSKYNYAKVAIPLVNEDGSCNIASQYSQERIAELKLDHRTWLAQYQQSPEPRIELSFVGQVFSYETLKASAKRNVAYENAPYKCLGVDPKREGTDTFSIVVRTGKKAQIIFNDKRAFDTFAAADLIIKYADLYQVDDIAIDKGKGEGIIDELKIKRKRKNIHEVDFGGGSHRADAFNKRSAMYNDLSDWIDAGGVLPDHKDLFDELAAQEFADDAGNLFKLAPKKKVKERIGRSPGLADALALTFAVALPQKDESDVNVSNFRHFKPKNTFLDKLRSI